MEAVHTDPLNSIDVKTIFPCFGFKLFWFQVVLVSSCNWKLFQTLIFIYSTYPRLDKLLSVLRRMVNKTVGCRLQAVHIDPESHEKLHRFFRLGRL